MASLTINGTLTASYDVNVNSGTANLTINSGGTLTCTSTTSLTVSVTGNLIIASGGTFAVVNATNPKSHVLTLGGNFTNNGTFTSFASPDDFIDVTLSGTSAQSIGGTTATAFNDLTISNTPAPLQRQTVSALAPVG